MQLYYIGHVYAAGAMMALTHDYRIMRNDRGWFCLPEVHLKIPFTVGMMSLLKSVIIYSITCLIRPLFFKGHLDMSQYDYNHVFSPV